MYFEYPADPQPFKCKGCGRWYVLPKGGIGIGCCVLHAPGTCCHMGEIALTEEQSATLEKR